ncbi:hypothetical protein CALCODRAFT_503722 [Calocera cornea HHB12733]|uniref:TPR-like protein n=1 Tax=Calocera cornea HHB12733 TaxID=1353952 RepID=A0A165CRT2_9BASI|nr:hypothetical protein CALCODRAFT_503722 [Calocera cornea HHB12733]
MHPSDEGYETPEEEGFSTPKEEETPATPFSGRSEISDFTTTTSGSFATTPSTANTTSSMRSEISNLSTEGYSRADALEDLPYVHHILNLFLSSRMLEAEDLVREGDPRQERLYFSTAWSIIQSIKAMMSFDDAELASAIEDARHTTEIAQKHRKPPPGIASRVAGLVVGGSNLSFVKNMTDVERHAELVYAETLLIKAVLGIVSSGDWLAFIKEALHMRSALNIYKHLDTFIQQADKDAAAHGEPEDEDIDQDFRSGVLLGMGINSLVLSLLPSKVITIVELFGYKSDRQTALKLLAKPGGWTKERDEPAIDAEHEGIRRCVCDMVLIMFHLVLNSITFAGIDVKFAEKMLNWNLKRFPEGVFYLFMQGRLHVSQSQPRLAIAAYDRAAQIQKEYVQLQHVAYWEQGILLMSMADLTTSVECWRKLIASSSWSKAVYTYGLASCLVQGGDPSNIPEAQQLMKLVPTYKQRIAGKSIPIEKFTARKGRKFQSQGNRLLLPAFEFATVMQVMGRMTPKILQENVLPLIQKEIAALKSSEPKKWGNGTGYWDDLCLARYMEGVVLRYIAYPDPDAVLEADDKVDVSQDETAKAALAAFQEVLDNGAKIELDHYIVYYTHYDLGRLHANIGNIPEAKRQLEMVMSGKPLEVNAAGKKGKYSLENALMVRTHAANEALDQGRGV